MSIASAREDIRGRREVVVISRKPWAWRVKSTSGDYHHLLRWDQVLKDIVCDTCLSRHGRRQCWARTRCLKVLRAEMEARRGIVTADRYREVAHPATVPDVLGGGCLQEKVERRSQDDRQPVILAAEQITRIPRDR